MKRNFDLIVIGTGAGGSTAAHKCRKAGWSVAIIDQNPFGGTCALRGCDPKKVLMGAAELVDFSERLQGNGVAADSKINWQELMEFKRRFTNPVSENKEKNFKKAGIETFHGTAEFINENTIEINNEKLIAKHFLIANGAKSAKLNIRGEEYFTYSDQFLELNELPDKIIFVGGGYISFEFAHIAARAGAKVTILHRGDNPLKGFDKDLVQLLLKKSREIDIEIELNTEVKSIDKNNGRYKVTADKNKTEKLYEVEIVVHGAGRVPELDKMNLKKGNVKRGKAGVIVNEYLQSVSNPLVYSAGDSAATDGLPLTPVATMESHIAASNLINGNNKKADYSGIPTVVFTIPHLASVGMNEEDARMKKLNFIINFKETSGWYSSKRINERYSAFKTIIEKETGKILGAHLLGHHSEELINLFALAIKHNITTSDLKSTIYSYPTSSSDIAYMV
ncbi:MAG: NAD(P)/FAD-dependent oxidoreductase [Ignavibacteriaceae bacterium]